MTKLERLLAIVLIIGTIFGIFTTLPTMIDTIKKPDVWNSGTIQVLFVTSIFGGLIVVNIILIILFVRFFGFLLYRVSNKPQLEVSLSEESRTYVGEDLLFDVKFSSVLLYGFFAIKIRSPYWEEREDKIRFDDIKKRGQLHGNYTDREIKLKCRIPSDFGHGEYDVIISIFDVIPWLFSFQTTHLIIEKQLKIKINRL